MNQYLANRLRELFLDGKWIANTNYKEQLSNLTSQQANQQIGNLNTVAMLTFHIDYYLGGLIQVLQGGELTIRDKYSFDMPPIQTENDWKELVERLLHHAELFANLVEQLDNKQFQQPFVKEEYGTYLRNIEGVIEHSYYHLGQISLIGTMASKS